MKRIAAVVVLYQPKKYIFDNIQSYYDFVDLVIVIDNSERPDNEIKEWLASKNKIHTVLNRSNLGIGKALNSGCEIAISKGFQWILTMDQDSSFSSDIISRYLECFEKLDGSEKAAIISPIHISSPIDPEHPCIAEETTHVMTSGNLLNLTAYRCIGGFNESLFIDEVDHDYCLRARLKKYSIIEMPHVYLFHELGEEVEIRKNGQSIKTRTHSPLRFYYITRNRLYIWRRYSRHFPSAEPIGLTNIAKPLLFALLYHDQKLHRLYHIGRGIYHFLIGRYGK